MVLVQWRHFVMVPVLLVSANQSYGWRLNVLPQTPSHCKIVRVVRNIDFPIAEVDQSLCHLLCVCREQRAGSGWSSWTRTWSWRGPGSATWTRSRSSTAGAPSSLTSPSSRSSGMSRSSHSGNRDISPDIGWHYRYDETSILFWHRMTLLTWWDYETSLLTLDDTIDMIRHLFWH